MSKALRYHSLLPLLVLLALGGNTAAAQTTEFSYQGKLIDGALPANANYDFEFRLFAIGSGGTAIATQSRLAVPVANGIFTVTLDFGGQFDGNGRWLEIAVKPAASPNPLLVLTPRQPLTSTPYSIRSLSSARADLATNSLQLSGVNANQYVLTTDSRMTDARSPLPNSANYVQNTTAQQSSSNFSISGNGTAGGSLSANAVNATTQYNLGGNRILSNLGTNNLFAGVSAGLANTSGTANSFFGSSAGAVNTSGGSNSFFGSSSGAANTTGDQNSFFGFFAGLSNTTAARNSYFGYRAGQQGMTNNDNSFYGYRAGIANTANGNAFFGASAGDANTTGNSNSFFGNNAGGGNTSGGSNVFFGNGAGSNNTTGSNNTLIGAGANVGATHPDLTFATAIGAGARADFSNTITLGRSIDTVFSSGPFYALGLVTVLVPGASGSDHLCLNGSYQISYCSSSLRYKTSVQPFSGGLDIVRRLRPIAFNWKDSGKRDVGFAAEDVERIQPLLTTTNAKGEIEGVKYGQLTAVLVNAIREQQTQLEQQQKQIQQQQQIINSLRKLICRHHPTAEVCPEKQ